MASKRWLHTSEHTVALGDWLAVGFDPHHWAIPFAVQYFSWSRMLEVWLLCFSLKVRRPRSDAKMSEISESLFHCSAAPIRRVRE